MLTFLGLRNALPAIPPAYLLYKTRAMHVALVENLPSSELLAKNSTSASMEPMSIKLLIDLTLLDEEKKKLIIEVSENPRDANSPKEHTDLYSIFTPKQMTYVAAQLKRAAMCSQPRVYLSKWLMKEISGSVLKMLETTTKSVGEHSESTLHKVHDYWTGATLLLETTLLKELQTVGERLLNFEDEFVDALAIKDCHSSLQTGDPLFDLLPTATTDALPPDTSALYEPKSEWFGRVPEAIYRVLNSTYGSRLFAEIAKLHKEEKLTHEDITLFALGFSYEKVRRSVESSLVYFTFLGQSGME